MRLQGEIIREACSQWPNTPTKTLAHKIYAENPEVFKDAEYVRTGVRYYRGQRGDGFRKYKTHEYPSKIYSPFDELPAPLTDYADWSHHVLTPGKWLVLADLHVPYYCREELIVALQYGLDEEVDGIVLLGDIADFYSCSFWCKDPRRRDFKKERDAVLAVLSVIRNLFPTIPIVYKLGNHEERLERYLRIKAPELLDLELIDFRAIIEAKRFNIDIVGDKRIIKLGRLYLLHGHEFGKGFFSPVNPARGLYLKGKEISLCAHYHQTSQHTEKSMADVVTSCWSIGGLCDLHPEYAPLNKWNHGFAIVDARNEFVVKNPKIIHGQVY